MYTLGMYSVKDTLRSVNDQARHARRRKFHTSSCSSVRLRRRAPVKRGVARRFNSPAPAGARLMHGLYCGFVFAIVSGAIALFATGTGIKTGTPTAAGLIVAACVGALGFAVGYFTKR